MTAAVPERFFPWNPDHPCFAGNFEDRDPFDHDMKYEDTSQGDGLYFQQSGHMQCERCELCTSTDGWFDVEDDYP